MNQNRTVNSKIDYKVVSFVVVDPVKSMEALLAHMMTGIANQNIGNRVPNFKENLHRFNS